MQINGYSNVSTQPTDTSSKISSLQASKSQYLSQKLQIEANEYLSSADKETQVATLEKQIASIDAEIAKLQSSSLSSKVQVKSKDEEKTKSSEKEKIGPAVIVEDSLKELIKKIR